MWNGQIALYKTKEHTHTHTERVKESQPFYRTFTRWYKVNDSTSEQTNSRRMKAIDTQNKKSMAHRTFHVDFHCIYFEFIINLHVFGYFTFSTTGVVPSNILRIMLHGTLISQGHQSVFISLHEYDTVHWPFRRQFFVRSMYSLYWLAANDSRWTEHKKRQFVCLQIKIAIHFNHFTQAGKQNLNI